MTPSRAEPTADELAAIVAAVELSWPRPVVVVAATDTGDDQARASQWRFSGRWWSRPIPARRVRPW